ncbi:unnamed protein product [Thelazia callipaeda]|uniref:NR LBD domain-containing protein n=1 Tax=Thelazia callipaeda TaxID=103827 RepID=A0A0N5D3M7_THECL|nr:unnamed protein product [Thelazia callipaeda]
MKNFSLTCHALNVSVREYVLSNNAAKRFQYQVSQDSSELHKEVTKSYAWGKLLNMCTICSPASQKSSVMISFYLKVELYHSIISTPFLAYRSLNWDPVVCTEFMNSVIAFSETEPLLVETISAKAGEKCDLEMEIRKRFHGFFLDQNRELTPAYGLWMSMLLHTQKTMEDKGRLFMILFGPTKCISGKELIDWNTLSEKNLTKAESNRIIQPLSSKIYCLLSLRELNLEFSWCYIALFNLMEEITSAPKSWTLDNFACLLLMESKLMRIAFYFRLNHSAWKEAATIFHAIKAVYHRRGCERLENFTATFLNIFRLLSPLQRRHFFAQIIMMQTQILRSHLHNRPCQYFIVHFFMNLNRRKFHNEMAATGNIAPLLTLLSMNIVN